MKKVEDIVRQVVKPADLKAVVSNIGVNPDLSALSTPNSAMHTAFVQVGLQGGPQDRQLRLYGPGAKAHRAGACRNCARIFNPADWWTPY